MIYALSIDWLSLYVWYSEGSKQWVPVTGDSSAINSAYPWRYTVEPYGTRQFHKLTRVDMPNEQGGYDKFAEVQSDPVSAVVNARGMVVRFNNRVLYRSDMWELAERFLRENNMEFRSISRIDICADLNRFETIGCLQLIKQFASSELRHVGRGVGALYFNHGVAKKTREYGVRYTGLSFGTHASDARVYLYNKSFELATQGDKPYIRDRWKACGLDLREVWRLEVSLKSKACTFSDRKTKQQIVVDTAQCQNVGSLSQIYHTFVSKMFAFVRNRPGITNITREPRVILFAAEPRFDRHVLRNVTGSNRLDKMVIKALYTLGAVYRGAENVAMADEAQSFAIGIAESTDLCRWMAQRVDTWTDNVHR